MKAAIFRKFGPPEVLSVEDIEKPSPGEGEVLVKVLYAAINPFDWKLRGNLLPVRVLGNLFGKKVRRTGSDFAGIIEAVGKDVPNFKKGDQVFGYGRGACAEFINALSSKMAIKPANVSFEEAAAVSVAAMTALQGLKDCGGIKPGDKVLIYGASGGVGHYAVQIAKAMGAKVDAVTSTSNLSWVKALGADEVINYTREDFAKRGKTYDIIFDTVGYAPYFKSRRCLTETGVFVSANFFNKVRDAIEVPIGMLFRKKRARFFITRGHPEDFEFLAGLMAKAKLKTRIDRRYKMDDIVKAQKYGERGHTKGKIVIEINPLMKPL